MIKYDIVYYRMLLQVFKSLGYVE